MEVVVRWGMVTGLLIAAWLYVSYWLGLHTNGPLVFQIVPLG
jgi:hypothetical protein